MGSVRSDGDGGGSGAGDAGGGVGDDAGGDGFALGGGLVRLPVAGRRPTGTLSDPRWPPARPDVSRMAGALSGGSFRSDGSRPATGGLVPGSRSGGGESPGRIGGGAASGATGCLVRSVTAQKLTAITIAATSVADPAFMTRRTRPEAVAACRR